MGEFADDLIDAGYSDYSPEPGDHYWCGPPRPKKPLCTSSDIRHIVENIVARKGQKPISREVLDKHFAEIAKIRFNPNTNPGDIERAIEDLQIKVASAESSDAVDLYRRIALCAVLLADAAENGKR